MVETPQHNALLALLIEQLDRAQTADARRRTHNATGTLISVPGVGKTISGAYEQLRNAAEYTEEHLLLERAIRRFYRRNLFLSKTPLKHIGEELIVELTQAGYLGNATMSAETAQEITDLAHQYAELPARLREAHVPREEALDWPLSVLSVETENRLNPHSRSRALAGVAYAHFLQLLPKDRFIRSPAQSEAYELCLYISIHQALLRSDIAVVRHDLIRMYDITITDIPEFVRFNEKLTELYLSQFTQSIRRAVIQHVAPFRVLKSMVNDHSDIVPLLRNKPDFLEAYRRQVRIEYEQVDRRIDKGIAKSIIFILITKMLIGIGVEVPYDLLVVGSIALLPLAVNLFFPPLYMASLKLWLKIPSTANAHALENYVETIFYTDHLPVYRFRQRKRIRNPLLRLAYALILGIPFAVTVLLLINLQFNPLQMVIFFVFLSTASFLGFRLSSLVRELELQTRQPGLLSSLRDFFYLPFILLGQWLTGKYARINFVGSLLDIAIELPLKTVLRLTRQWMRFLNDKREEIY